MPLKEQIAFHKACLGLLQAGIYVCNINKSVQLFNYPLSHSLDYLLNKIQLLKISSHEKNSLIDRK